MSKQTSHPHSEYIVFVDESGDHNLKAVDNDYPIFALAFVITSKEEYFSTIVPNFLKLKFKYWGHDQIILHEHEIRKSKHDFAKFRTDSLLRETFLQDLHTLIENSAFQYTASIIDKHKLLKKYANPYNPYHIALQFCMESLLDFLIDNNETNTTIHIVAESRGTKEDSELQLEFEKICDNKSWGSRRLNFKNYSLQLHFSNKSCNSTGLQLADLIVRPVGLRYLKSEQENRTSRTLDIKKISEKIFP